MEKENKKKLKGFSLIESILAVFLVTFGIVTVFPLLGLSSSQTIDSRDQIIAAFLSQEGVELVRNIRDDNWAKKEDGIPGYDGAFEGLGNNFPNFSASNCLVSFPSGLAVPEIPECNSGGGGDRYLYLDGNGKYVTESSGNTKTRFQRKISIQYDVSKNTATVESMVIWSGGTFPATSACNTKSKCVYSSVVLTRWND